MITGLLAILAAEVQAQAIEVDAFASLPSVRQVKISPDGARIASLTNITTAEVSGTAVNIYDVESGDANLRLFTDNEKFVIQWIRWANPTLLLVSARFPAERFGTPTTETRVIVLDSVTGENHSLLSPRYLRKLSLMPQFQDNVIDLLPDSEDEILLSHAVDRGGHSRVVRVNLTKNRAEPVVRKKKGVRDWITDRQHVLRIGTHVDDTTYKILHRPNQDAHWQTLWEFEAFAQDAVWPIGFDHNPNLLYVKAYHEGRKAIFKVDLGSEGLPRELVFSDPRYDVEGGIIYSRKAKKVVGVRHSMSAGLEFFDDTYQALQRGLDKALPDTTNVIYNFDDEERRYVALATSDTNAGVYYLGDRDSGELTQLASRHPRLDPALMATKQEVSYAARDGLEISAYLTLPRDAGDGPVPAIVFPHGGPISYDGSGFDYWTQFFASRGYAVLQMNFRGSAGYGYEFMKSGLQNWGLEMQNDVEDGSRWLIEQGIADPGRICMVGASYGGYAALMEAARNSDLYRCAVSFAGVTDVAYLVRSYRRYSNYDIVKAQVGDDLKALRRRSPLKLVEDIDIPVLLVHGTKDRRVRVDHSRKMHKALTKAGKDVEYIEQHNGDHHLSNQTHRIELFRALDRFLSQHLTLQAQN